MGFFEQLGKKASDTMQSAKEKTNKFSAEMKLKSQLSEKKEKINAIYCEIGKAVHENFLKGITEVSDVISGKSNEISALDKEIQDLNAQLLAVKGIKICPNCGGQINVGSEFCPKCGKKVVEVAEQAPEAATPTEATVEENAEEKKEE